MCTFVAIGGGGGSGGLNNQVAQFTQLSFRPDKSAFQIWKQSNTYKLLVIRQSDNEISVDGVDVHAADKPLYPNVYSYRGYISGAGKCRSHAPERCIFLTYIFGSPKGSIFTRLLCSQREIFSQWSFWRPSWGPSWIFSGHLGLI